MKICPRCNLREANTRDHIIPKVLKRICEKYDIESAYFDDTVRMCGDCNGKKGMKLASGEGFRLKRLLLDFNKFGSIYLTSREINYLRLMNKLK